MENRISYTLQCAALGALGGLGGVVVRQYFLTLDIPPFLPEFLRLVAGPLAGAALGAGLGFFSSMMMEKNAERMAGLRRFFPLSILLDGLMLGLFLH